MIKRREFLTHTLAAGGFLTGMTSEAFTRLTSAKEEEYRFSVFTKAWKMPLPELAAFVESLGFDGIELPVRPGYQVEPEKVIQDLPAANRLLADRGLRIFSIAGLTDEQTIATCGELHIPLIRIMVEIPEGMRYQQALDETRKRFDLLLPILDKHQVKIGIQNHCGRFIANSSMLMQLLNGYDPKHFAVVWDPAHEALCGTEPDLALDVVESHLTMVNLKNGVRRRKDRSASGIAEWDTVWTSGKEGYASWPRIAAELQNRKWMGIICLCAEYSEKEAVNRMIAEDFAFAKPLFKQI
jgi:sugar phosphate isomerase/epimerase